MRITGGEARGRRLKAPQGAGTRPTADRVRESIFNILGQRLAGERVLDLFAGSGAMGLEALSRGAATAVLVEKDREAARVCAENASALGYAGRVEIVRAEVATAFGRLSGTFDLVFVDPPYALGPASTLELLGAGKVGPGGVVVAEHDRRTELAERYGALVRRDCRRFGETAVSFYAHSPQEPA